MEEENQSRINQPADSVDMLHGPLPGKIILFAIPLAASSILQQLFNAADTAVVGRFASSQAMAAVGSNSSVINLIVGLFVGLSVGANVVIASLIGQGKKREISQAVHTAVSVAFLSGVLLAAVGVTAAGPLLRLMNTPEDVIDLATLYLRIYFMGMPFLMLYNFGAAILRSKGDSKRPVYALVAAGVLNVILNLVMVIGMHLHVIGVALATVIANGFSSGLVISFLAREEGEFRLHLKKLGIRKEYLLWMIRIGLPAGIQGVVFSLSNTVIQTAINSFGSAASAGSAAALNYEIIAFYSVNAFNQATVTFTSQNYAAGKYARCKKVFRISFLCALLITAALDMFMILTRNWTLRLFTTDPEVLEFASTRLLSVLAFQWLVSTYEISGSALRGMGYSMTPAVLTVFGTCIFRIFWVTALFPMHRSFRFLLTVYPATWILTGTMVLSAYLVIRRRIRPNIL